MYLLLQRLLLIFGRLEKSAPNIKNAWWQKKILMLKQPRRLHVEKKTKAAQAAAAGTQADNQATNADGANEGVDAGAKAPSFKDKLLGIFGGKKES